MQRGFNLSVFVVHFNVSSFFKNKTCGAGLGTLPDQNLSLLLSMGGFILSSSQLTKALAILSLNGKTKFSWKGLTNISLPVRVSEPSLPLPQYAGLFFFLGGGGGLRRCIGSGCL